MLKYSGKYFGETNQKSWPQDLKYTSQKLEKLEILNYNTKTKFTVNKKKKKKSRKLEGQ